MIARIETEHGPVNQTEVLSPNVALVKSLYDLFARKDYEAFREISSPDILWIQNEGFPGGATHQGADAVIRDVFQSFRNEWDGWKYEIDEYLDAGATVIVLGRYVGTHRSTGKAMTSSAAHVYDLNRGRITRFRQYADTHSIVRAME